MTTATDSTRTIVTGSRTTPRGRRAGSRNREQLISWVFLAPFLVAFALFLVWPIIHGVILSFTDQSLTGAGGTFVGFANYAEAFVDPKMWQSMGNTVWFTLLSTVPLVVIALLMAALVDRGLPGQWLWRLSFFMPYLLASTVISQIWVWIFNPQIGAANNIIFGMSFVGDATAATTKITTIAIFQGSSFNFCRALATCLACFLERLSSV